MKAEAYIAWMKKGLFIQVRKCQNTPLNITSGPLSGLRKPWKPVFRVCLLWVISAMGP